VVGDDPVTGSFVMRTPISDPDVDLRVAGRLDLADVGRTVLLDGVEELTGVVTADAAMRARLSDLDHGRYDRVGASGSIAVAGLALAVTDMPHALRVDDALLRFTPSHAELATLHGTIGSSDVALSGRIDNLLGFVLRDEELRGSARLESAFFDLNEWRSDDDVEAIIVPGNLDFAVDAAVARLAFGTLDLRNARGALRIRDQRASLEDVRMDLLGGALAVSGWYETIEPARPLFDIDVRMTDVDVAAAAGAFATVRAFAPVARFAQGRVSADLRLNGALGSDLAPVLDALSGLGSFRTAGIALHDFPAMDRLADALKIRELAHPVLTDISSTIRIQDGRLHVQPFDVRVGEFALNVSGSNGIDQSLDYTIALQLPRALLGGEADRVLTGMVAQTARAGLVLQPGDVVTVRVLLTGTVTDPAIGTSFQNVAGSTATAVQQALQQEAERRIEAVEQRIDEAAEEARLRARAEAARFIAETEQRAATIREEARVLADAVRREADEQAAALVARATNPAARLAAQQAANRLRREADERAERLVRDADARADALVEEARRRGGDGAGGGEPPATSARDTGGDGAGSGEPPATSARDTGGDGAGSGEPPATSAQNTGSGGSGTPGL
jgi:hypothetical protein